MRLILTPVLALGIVGCTATSTAERPMNESEKTYLSPQVAQLVAEDEDGIVDIRDEPEIRCERFKRTGTHLVTRHCYTLAEKDAMEGETQDRMRDRFGKMSCLDRTLGGACSNASPQDPFSGLAGRNPGGG